MNPRHALGLLKTGFLTAARCFPGNRRGNMAMIFGITMLPLMFAVGMGVDYSQAAKRRTRLDAAADAAALAAVTPALMADTTTTAQQAAINMFNAQAGVVMGVTYNASNLTVTITQTGTTSISRTAVVTYSASSKNAFGGILGINSIAIGGSSTATVSAAPNINFYVLLDTSPSMALPATSAGISSMIAHTQSQTDSVNGQTVKGCAFACHESCPSCESPPLGNPGGTDNYQLARNLGLTLRIDNVVTAASNLASTAKSTAAQNGATYKMSVNTFDIAVNSSGGNYNQVAPLSSNLSQVASNANSTNIKVLEVYWNNWLTSSNNNSDADTDWDNAMNTMNAGMPNPGGGTNAANDTPQEVVFLVTDGVRDETDASYQVYSRAQTVMYNSGAASNGTSYDWCSTIKNRGIRIAVLYTTYISLYDESSWYDAYIYPFQGNIASTLQTCASPGLFTQVNTDQDISAALQNLFQAAVATAHLTH